MPNLVAEDSPRRHIVSITEAAGDAEDLRVRQDAGILQRAIEMQDAGLPARHFKRKSRLLIAVGAGSTQDDDAGNGHDYESRFACCSRYQFLMLRNPVSLHVGI